jgi:hypothetical protein
MEMMWLMGGFMVFCLLLFLAVAFLFPESVGIQGKFARKIEENQKDKTNV